MMEELNTYNGLEQEFFEPILQILGNNPNGINEYNLVTQLREEGYSQFAAEMFSSDMALFKAHFLLFHILYKLRDRLLEKKEGILEIHCLNIILHPYSEPKHPDKPAEIDPMRSYYLDTDNLKNTDEAELQKMLSRFYKKLEAHTKRKTALDTLGLSDNADYKKAKHTYLKLAKENHPDTGGDAERFRDIQEAMETLKILYATS